MKDRIRTILAKIPEVSDWNLKLTKTHTSELFYVGKKLETNRAADTASCDLTIYVDRGEERGASTFSVADYMTDEELRDKIEENVYAAGFAMNPWYDLPVPANAVIPESESNIRAMSLKEAAEQVSDAVFAADHYDDGYLSATEIFITETTLEVLNSRGVDVCSTTYGGMVELIPSWEKAGEEVEIYHMLRFESIDPQEITKQVNEQLLLAKARFEARPLSELIDMKKALKIIIQDEEVGEIFGYFEYDLTYRQKYEKSNKFELGDKVQGDEVVQLYVRSPKGSGDRRVHHLEGFRRLRLDPGETKSVSFTLKKEQLMQFGMDGRQTLAKGEYSIFVGGGQPGFTEGVLGGMVAY